MTAAVVVAYGSLAVVQASHWRNSVCLFQHAVAVGEKNPYSLTTLGWALVSEKRFDEALPPLRQAVELTPDFGQAQFLLACVLQLDRGNARVQANLAELYVRIHQFNEAITPARRGLELDPTHMQCRRLIVIALRDQGRLDEAVEQLQQLLAIAPDDRARSRNCNGSWSSARGRLARKLRETPPLRRPRTLGVSLFWAARTSSRFGLISGRVSRTKQR